MKAMKSEELQSAIHEERILIFLETGPQSGKFNQVLLTMEHFKKVSDAIAEGFIIFKEGMKKDFEGVEMQVSVEEYEIPDLQSIDS